MHFRRFHYNGFSSHTHYTSEKLVSQSLWFEPLTFNYYFADNVDTTGLLPIIHEEHKKKE